MHPDVDIVLNALVGAAGLDATLAALRAGKRVALANKESLVMAGDLVAEAARQGGGELVPVDSEHSAVLQCVTGHNGKLARLILTASGGPFRGLGPRRRWRRRTVEQALNHPTWRMGSKITVDSATLANKALEVIEAHFLFGLSYDQVDVVVHPQSIVHAFAEFCDGNVMAQVGFPTMELPILYALTHPDRLPDSGTRRFDPVAAGHLTFEPVRADVFRAFPLGVAAGRAGGTVAGGVQCRQRGGGRRVPRGRAAVRAHRRRHRIGARAACAGAGARRRDRPCRRSPRPGTGALTGRTAMLVTLLAFAVTLGVLIFVHEFGHFAAAKWAGIWVHRFSIGIGSPIPGLTFKRGETEYSLSWLPLGGYVKMASEEEEASSAALEGGTPEAQVPPDRMFEAKPVWKRMIVILAGVTMNTLFAWLIFSGLALKNGKAVNPVTVVGVRRFGRACRRVRRLSARCSVGDQITAVNGRPVDSWNGVFDAAAAHLGQCGGADAGRRPHGHGRRAGRCGRAADAAGRCRSGHSRRRWRGGSSRAGRRTRPGCRRATRWCR